MLYNEFLEGTGCRDNDYNYKVYKDLEVMYSNSDITKQQIYEYGKKLVNNDKSKEQIAFENEIKAEIADYKQRILDYKRWVEYYKEVGNKEMTKFNNKEIKRCRQKIAGLKWVLEG